MKRVVRNYYGFQLFFSLLLWVPIFYEFQKLIGLSDGEIFGIQSFYYLAFCLLEVPTGALSDRYGHRQCMRFGALTLIISNLVPVFSANYFGFLVHFILIAVARSLISGAASAYLYDYLKMNGREKEYKTYEGRARAIGLVSKVFCWSMVGILMKWQMNLPYLLTAGNAFLAFIFASNLPDLPINKAADIEQKVSLVASKQSIFTLLTGGSPLLLIMLQGVGLFVMQRLCQVNLFQPLLKEQGFQLISFGVVMSMMTLCEAAAAANAGRIRHLVKDHLAIYILTLIMAGSFFLLIWPSKIVMLVGLAIFSFSAGLAFPIQKQLLNDHIIDSRMRATLLSVESILDRAVCALVIFQLGGQIQAGKIFGVFNICAILFMALVSIFYYLITSKIKKRKALVKIY